MNEGPVLQVIFFRTESGREPVREWLKEMSREDRVSIGESIKKSEKTPMDDLELARKRKELWLGGR